MLFRCNSKNNSVCNLIFSLNVKVFCTDSNKFSKQFDHFWADYRTLKIPTEHFFYVKIKKNVIEHSSFLLG